MGMHTSQRPPAKVESEAFNFMQFMHLIVSGGNRDRCIINNMDQPPVYFTMNAKRMLEVIGEKTIHICTSTNNTTCVTVAVMILVDGTLVPSTLVFKGKPSGCIATKEFPSGNYPTTHFYKCQEAAWMDKEVMIVCVYKVLAPYIVMAPYHIIPILILNMYQCHMMALVV